MAIVTLECDGDHSVHDEALRIRQMLAEAGLVPVSISPGTVRNLKLSFAVEFKTDEEAARFRGAAANGPRRRPG
jgi:hypothetical protein